MNAYSSAFSPPAPLALVTLSRMAESTSLPDVPMLIDSGADVSLVPKSSVLRLELDIEQHLSIELEGFDGQRSGTQPVSLDLRLGGKTFRGRFLITEQEVGILGRNILNHFVLTLDGPNLAWQVT